MVPYINEFPDFSWIKHVDTGAPNLLERLGNLAKRKFEKGSWVVAPAVHLSRELRNHYMSVLSISGLERRCGPRCTGTEVQQVTSHFDTLAVTFESGREENTGIQIEVSRTRVTVKNRVQMTWYNMLAQFGSYVLQANSFIVFLFPTTIGVSRFFKCGRSRRDYKEALERLVPVPLSEL